MIYYDNMPKVKNLMQSVITLNDFKGVNTYYNGNLLKGKYADVSYNFDFDSGALTSGTGIKELEIKTSGGSGRQVHFPLNKKPLSAYYYRRYDDVSESYKDMILCYVDDGYMYGLEIDGVATTFTKISGLSFTTKPTCINYKYNGESVILISTEQDGLYVYNGNTVTAVTGAPDITSMCIHYERLYVTTGGEATSLWFSDDFDPTNWYVSIDEAGYIDFQDDRGKLLKVLSFQDYVYIFRSYGISRLSAYGDQRDFSVTNLFVSSGKIYADSITVCGDRIIFMAEDGLYVFDGSSTKKILDNYRELISGVDNSSAKGVFYNGKLYMLMDVNDQGTVKRVMLIYDLDSGWSYFYYGGQIIDLCLLSGDGYSNMIFVFENLALLGELSKISKEFESDLIKTYSTPFTDYGIIAKNKTLKKLYLYADSDLTLTVKSDKAEKSFIVAGDSRVTEIHPNLKGDVFSLEFSCGENSVHVSKLKLVFEYFKGE